MSGSCRIGMDRRARSGDQRRLSSRARRETSIVALLIASLVPWLISQSAFAQADPGGSSTPSFQSFAMHEGFELYRRVMTSECPVAFRDVWNADYEKLRKLSDALEGAVADFEAEKRALLDQKAFWGGNWHDDEAAAWIDGMSALNALSSLVNDFAKLAFPEVGNMPRYVVYKVISKTKDVVSFRESLLDGEVPLATYSAASALDGIPPDVKPVSDLVVALYKWQKTRRDFEAYRSELRRVLGRLDSEIAVAQGRLRTAQKGLRDRTDKGVLEFCRNPEKLVARDDYVSVSSQQQTATCFPVRDNDDGAGVPADRIRISAVGLQIRPEGKAEANGGGTCIRYRKPEHFIPEMIDRFDYEIRDPGGRTARATVYVSVVSCGSRTPLDHQKGIDPCKDEHAARDSASKRSPSSPQDDPDRSAGDEGFEWGKCSSGRIRVDELCWEKLSGEAMAARKCDPQYGWGTCSPAERAFAEAYGRDMRCERADAPVKVPNDEARGYLDRFSCVSEDDAKRLGFTGSRNAPAGPSSPDRDDRSTADGSAPSLASGSIPSTGTEAGRDAGMDPTDERRGSGGEGISGGGAGRGIAGGSNAAAAGAPGAGSSPVGGSTAASTQGAGSNPKANGPGSDASGEACSYFTRPAVEHSNSLGVKSVSLNYHGNGSVVCQSTSRYRCVAGRWDRIGSDCSKDDPRQAWRLEGGPEPKDAGTLGEPARDSATGGDGSKSSGSNPGSSGGPDSPYSAGSPYTADSPYATSSPFGSSSPFDPASGGPSAQGDGSPPLSSPFANDETNRPKKGGSASGSNHPTRATNAGNSGGGADSNGMTLTRECLRQQNELGQSWQRRCNAGLDGLGICQLNRKMAACMQEGIELARQLPCPREMIEESVAAMRNLMEQAKSGARQSCAQ